MAIALHLAAKAGPGIGPGDAAEAAAMANWAFFAASAIDPVAVVILFAAEEPAEKAEAAVAAMHRPLARLEAHLSGQDWLLDRFSAADICVAECLRYAQGHAGLGAAYPGTFDWLARCQARPAFKAMWARRLEEAA